MIEGLIISLIILFLHATTWRGHIFEKIKNIIPPEHKLYKVIYGCPICMTPWYGSLIYWIFFHISFMSYILTIGSASGLAVLYVCFITVRDGWLEYIKNNKDENKI